MPAFPPRTNRFSSRPAVACPQPVVCHFGLEQYLAGGSRNIMDLKKQLNIKSASVRRLLNDYKSYLKELSNYSSQLDTLTRQRSELSTDEEKNEISYKIKKQNEFITECNDTINDIKLGLNDSINILSKFLNDNQNQLNEQFPFQSEFTSQSQSQSQSQSNVNEFQNNNNQINDLLIAHQILNQSRDVLNNPNNTILLSENSSHLHSSIQ